MRAIYVSGGLFALIAAFGLGVVFGRFVLKSDNSTEISNSSIPGLFGQGQDNNGDVNQILDPAQMLPPPPTPNNMAQAEANAASIAARNCTVNATRSMPIKNWNNIGSISAIASGETCGNSLVRIILKTPDGKPVFTMTAPAHDFGVALDANTDALKSALEAALPDSAVRAAAYPAWKEGDAAPSGSEFNRDTYEAIRAANSPVICVKLPSAPQTCLASDPNTNEIKTLSRG